MITNVPVRQLSVVVTAKLVYPLISYFVHILYTMKILNRDDTFLTIFVKMGTYRVLTPVAWKVF